MALEPGALPLPDGPPSIDRLMYPCALRHLIFALPQTAPLDRRKSRTLIRALKSCDFDVPTAHPSDRAISSCLKPWTSWRRNTLRSRGASQPMASSRGPRRSLSTASPFRSSRLPSTSSSGTVLSSWARALPEVAVRGVDRDPEDPGRKGRRVPDVAHVAEDLEEDVLKEVFGDGPVLGVTVDQAEDRPLEHAVEGFQGGQVAGPAPGDEIVQEGPVDRSPARFSAAVPAHGQERLQESILVRTEGIIAESAVRRQDQGVSAHVVHTLIDEKGA
ncbi:MAG: hypothetical protein MZV63_25730 [Marinilabiliales bacterium]|nr:hypothetical protein [Marinilabiliales bacterium]